MEIQIVTQEDKKVFTATIQHYIARGFIPKYESFKITYPPTNSGYITRYVIILEKPTKSEVENK